MTRSRRVAGVIAAILVVSSTSPLGRGAEPGSSIVSSDPAMLDLGRRLFERHCQPCHGPEAVGENPAMPGGGWTGLGPIAPALNGTGHAWHHPPEYHVRVVRDGSMVPRSRMVGWGGRLSDLEILAVIAYFQSLWPARIRDAYRHQYLHRMWE